MDRQTDRRPGWLLHTPNVVCYGTPWLPYGLFIIIWWSFIIIWWSFIILWCSFVIIWCSFVIKWCSFVIIWWSFVIILFSIILASETNQKKIDYNKEKTTVGPPLPHQATTQDPTSYKCQGGGPDPRPPSGSALEYNTITLMKCLNRRIQFRNNQINRKICLYSYTTDLHPDLEIPSTF